MPQNQHSVKDVVTINNHSICFTACNFDLMFRITSTSPRMFPLGISILHVSLNVVLILTITDESKHTNWIQTKGVVEIKGSCTQLNTIYPTPIIESRCIAVHISSYRVHWTTTIWISKYIHNYTWDIMTHPCLNFNGDLAKSPAMSRRWLVIASPRFMGIQ